MMIIYWISKHSWKSKEMKKGLHLFSQMRDSATKFNTEKKLSSDEYFLQWERWGGAMMRERQIKERRAGEALKAGRTRWMLRMSEGITRQRLREREEQGRDGERQKGQNVLEQRTRMERERKRERERERERKINTVRAMCVGVVLHVYKPAAYLALLSPQKSVAQTNAHTCALWNVFLHAPFFQSQLKEHRLSYEALAISSVSFSFCALSILIPISVLSLRVLCLFLRRQLR